MPNPHSRKVRVEWKRTEDAPMGSSKKKVVNFSPYSGRGRGRGRRRGRGRGRGRKNVVIVKPKKVGSALVSALKKRAVATSKILEKRRKRNEDVNVRKNFHERQAHISILESKIFQKQQDLAEKKKELAIFTKKCADLKASRNKEEASNVKNGGYAIGSWAAAENRQHQLDILETMERRNVTAKKALSIQQGKNITIKRKIDDFRNEKQLYLKAFRDSEEQVKTANESFSRISVELEDMYKLRDSLQLKVSDVVKEFEDKKVKLTSALETIREEQKMIDKAREEQAERAARKALESNGGRRKKKGNRFSKKKGKSLRDRIKGVKQSNNDPGSSMSGIEYQSELWRRISEETGLDDVNDLVDALMNLEGEKMKRMHTLSTLNSEWVDLIKKIQDCETEQEKMDKIIKEKNKKRSAMVELLQSDVDRVENSLQKQLEKSQKQKSFLNSLDDSVRKLYALVTSSKAENIERHSRLVAPTPTGYYEELPPKTMTLGPSELAEWTCFCQERIKQIVQLYAVRVADRYSSERKKHNKDIVNKEDVGVKNVGRGSSMKKSPTRKLFRALGRGSVGKGDNEGEGVGVSDEVKLQVTQPVRNAKIEGTKRILIQGLGPKSASELIGPQNSKVYTKFHLKKAERHIHHYSKAKEQEYKEEVEFEGHSKSVEKPLYRDEMIKVVGKEIEEKFGFSNVSLFNSEKEKILNDKLEELEELKRKMKEKQGLSK
eukprot:g3142.t1